MDEGSIERLLPKIRCTVCGCWYDPAGTQVLAHALDLWFLRVWCSECANSSLVIAKVGEDDQIVGIGDLTEKEFERFADAAPISADDVLDVHGLLHDPTVGVSDIFCQGMDG
jgi:hypothetical protein